MAKSLSSRSRIDWPAILTASPAALIALVCCVLPLLWMVVAAVMNPNVRSELVITDFRAHLLARTIGYNGIAAVIATLMGLPAALVLGRGRGWFARFLWLLLPAALLMPSLSYAYGWAQFVRLLQLFVQNFSLAHFGPDHIWQLPMRAAGPLDVFRCIWSLAAWLWAVPAGLIGLALRRMDTNVQQQAILEGVLYRITFRQMLGPIIASLAIVTVLATQEFAVYEPTGISVVATEVRMVFDTGAISSPTNTISGPVAQGAGTRSPDQAARAAAAVATTMPLLICTITLALIAVWGASRTEADALTTGPWPRVLNAPRWAVVLTIGLLLLNIAVPVASLVASLHVRFSIPRMINEFAPEVQGAIFVAGLAAVLATIYAFSAAGRWTPGLMIVAGASFLIGGQLLAIALIRIFNRELFPGFTNFLGTIAHHLFHQKTADAVTAGIKEPFNLSDWAYGAFPVPVIAYVGRFGWLALAGGRGTWSRSWRELRDMSAVDGAGALGTAFSIVWPLAWPTLLAGALLVGALSMTEVPATVLLFPAHPQVLTPKLMTWLHQARSDPMIEASLLMMMSVVLPAAAALSLVAIGRKLADLRMSRTQNP